MADVSTSEQLYVVPVARVFESIEELLRVPRHPFFVAYLHLRRQAARQGTTDGIEPNWSELGEFLLIPGVTDTPYYRPFWNRKPNISKGWLNGNIAGSFAPSSLRVGTPQHNVIDVDADGNFALRENHWRRARESLLEGGQVPALAAAAFFLRDYGVRAESLPTPVDLVDLFRQEFGYDRPADPDEFSTLFDETWKPDTEPWFEPFTASGGGS